MSRTTYDVVEEYTGNGALADYTFDFKIESLSQLLVAKYNATGTEVFKVRGDDVTYLDSVEFDATAGGGTVHLAAVVESNYTLKILLANDEPTQAYEFKNKFSFTMSRIEAALDAVMGPIQRLAYLSKRSVKLDDYDSPDTFDPTLPVGLSANTSNLIPHVITGGWAPLADWTPLADLAAAVAAAAAAAVSAAEAAASAVVAAGHASSMGVIVGAGAIAQTTFNITNNQATPASVTGLIFDYTVSRSGYIRYTIQRITTGGGATSLVETGIIFVAYRPDTATWDLIPGPSGADYAGVDFSITAGGQVQYVSSNITGTPSVSQLAFAAMTMEA